MNGWRELMLAQLVCEERQHEAEEEYEHRKAATPIEPEERKARGARRLIEGMRHWFRRKQEEKSHTHN